MPSWDRLVFKTHADDVTEPVKIGKQFGVEMANCAGDFDQVETYGVFLTGEYLR